MVGNGQPNYGGSSWLPSHVKTFDTGILPSKQIHLYGLLFQWQFGHFTGSLYVQFPIQLL